jgi:uncharacterized protein (DUF302 family)
MIADHELGDAARHPRAAGSTGIDSAAEPLTAARSDLPAKRPRRSWAAPAQRLAHSLSGGLRLGPSVSGQLRLKGLLVKKGIHVFAEIDHAAEAKKVGLQLRPTQVLIFGNPTAGTPLMQSQQTAGLDLPLRVLVWEDEAGKIRLTYHPLDFLARVHHVADQHEAIQALETGLAALARTATSP